jgi:microcystin-dependent protein
MSDPTSINLQLSLPVRGGDVGVWDTPVNGDFNILDSAFGGVASVSLSGSPVTLSITQAQNSVLRFSGTISTNITVTLPAIVKFWTVENNTSGAFVVTLTTGSGKVIGLPPGEPSDVYSDGTDVKFKNLGRTGLVELWYLTALPAWVSACTVLPYLNLDGSTFNATTYAALNTFLGGNTLPDLRGRMPAGLNQGTGRITLHSSGGVDGNTLGASGGESEHTLLSNELPVITPSGAVTLGTPSWPSGKPERATAQASVSQTSFNVSVATIAGFVDVDFSLAGSFTGNAFGNNDPHNLMPPALMSGIFVIKT